MEEPKQLFSVLIICAILLFAVETFIPGGILGAFGIIALIGAIIVGYNAFPDYGTIVAVAIMFSTIILFILWLKILPKTWIAKILTSKEDLSNAHGTNESIKQLIDKKGVTLCNLHPSGFADIDGKKIDVITQGEMIDKGITVQVIDIESNRVIVKALQTKE